MKTIYKLILGITLLLLLNLPTQVFAANIKTGESIYISESEKNLNDIYLFGSTITSDALIDNDLIAAGSVVTLNGDVTGSVFAAGGDVFIRSSTANTLRAIGGNLVISGKTENDVLLAGSNIRLTDTASVEGDLLIAGGDIQINSPVKGKVFVYGGNVIINSRIGGNVEGNIGSITLGSKSEIIGDLKYKAREKATLNSGAIIRGKHNFQQIKKENKKITDITSAFTIGTLYKLATDILIGILLFTIFPSFTKNILENIVNNPVKSMASGFLFLICWPLISIFFLLLVLIGIISFLYYGIVLLIAVAVSKILIGWWIMNWLNKRDKKEYILDWRSAVVGSLTYFLLTLIPVIGWLAVGLIFLICIGGVIKLNLNFIQNQKLDIANLKNKKS